MLETLKKQVVYINIELNAPESKKMKPERVMYLIEGTKSIAEDLDKAKDLRGILESRVNYIYNKDETTQPKKRLNKVMKILNDELGLENKEKK